MARFTKLCKLLNLMEVSCGDQANSCLQFILDENVFKLTFRSFLQHLQSNTEMVFF